MKTVSWAWKECKSNMSHPCTWTLPPSHVPDSSSQIKFVARLFITFQKHTFWHDDFLCLCRGATCLHSLFFHVRTINLGSRGHGLILTEQSRLVFWLQVQQRHTNESMHALLSQPLTHRPPVDSRPAFRRSELSEMSPSPAATSVSHPCCKRWWFSPCWRCAEHKNSSLLFKARNLNYSLSMSFISCWALSRCWNDNRAERGEKKGKMKKFKLGWESKKKKEKKNPPYIPSNVPATLEPSQRFLIQIQFSSCSHPHPPFLLLLVPSFTLLLIFLPFSSLILLPLHTSLPPSLAPSVSFSLVSPLGSASFAHSSHLFAPPPPPPSHPLSLGGNMKGLPVRW